MEYLINTIMDKITEVTKEQLQLMIPIAPASRIGIYYIPLVEAMKWADISTPLRIAAFIAQVTHESGSLKYVEEISSGSAYETRRDLGNLEQRALDAAHSNHSTTGRFYKGHGLIQVTGYYNHRDCGVTLGINLVSNPRLLCEPQYASLSAAWFWMTHKLNKLADTGDIKEITRVINGGYNGLEDREANYTRCKQVLGV